MMMILSVAQRSQPSPIHHQLVGVVETMAMRIDDVADVR